MAKPICLLTEFDIGIRDLEGFAHARMAIEFLGAEDEAGCDIVIRFPVRYDPATSVESVERVARETAVRFLTDVTTHLPSAALRPQPPSPFGEPADP